MANQVVPSSGSLLPLGDKLSSDLQNMLDQLDTKVEAVVTQMDLVRKTRNELLDVTKNLEENLRVFGVNSGEDDEHEQTIQKVTSQIKKREELLKGLEKREMMMSHNMLNSINNWVKEFQDGTKTLEVSQIETKTSSSHKPSDIAVKSSGCCRKASRKDEKRSLSKGERLNDLQETAAVEEKPLETES